MFKKELTKAMRNIYVSRSVSKLKGKSSEFNKFIGMLSNKYSEVSVRRALKDLYYCTSDITDIKALTISKAARYHK